MDTMHTRTSVLYLVKKSRENQTDHCMQSDLVYLISYPGQPQHYTATSPSTLVMQSDKGDAIRDEIKHNISLVSSGSLACPKPLYPVRK